MPNSRLAEIVALLSEQIEADLSGKALEEHSPRYNGDDSDSFVKACNDRVVQLRAVRQQVEDIFTCSSAR